MTRTIFPSEGALVGYQAAVVECPFAGDTRCGASVAMPGHHDNFRKCRDGFTLLYTAVVEKTRRCARKHIGARSRYLICLGLAGLVIRPFSPRDSNFSQVCTNPTYGSALLEIDQPWRGLHTLRGYRSIHFPSS